MAREIAAFWRLDRNVRLFLISAALVGMTVLGGIFGVLFNLFILRLGFGTEFVGLVNATGLLAFALPALPAGWLAARWGTRPTLMLGLVVTGLGYGLLSLTDLLPADLRAGWLLTTNIIGSLGSAVYLVNTGPFLAEVTKPADRSRALSTQVAIWPLAGFIGSLIGGAAPDLISRLIGVASSDPATYRYTMFAAALAVFPGLLALRSTRIEPPAALPADHVVTRPPTRLIAQIALALALQVGSEGVVITFFNVYLDRGLQVPTAQIGLLLALARLASVPAALFTPLLINRWGLRRTFISASIGVVISVLPLALIPNWIAAEAGLLSMTCLAAVARSAISTYTMEVVDAPWRGSISAATTMGVGLSWSALALGGGYAIAAFGFAPLFLTGAACTMVGVALFMRVPPTRSERATSPAPM